MSDKPADPAPTSASAVDKAVLVSSTFRDRLGAGLVGGFLGALGLLFFKAIPTANEDLVIYMLGQLSGFAAGVVAYHYTMNSLNTQASGNTGKFADAFKAVAQSGTGSGQGEKGAAAEGAAEAAAAAEAEAERLRREAEAHEPPAKGASKP